jgi:hypothetical protein
MSALNSFDMELSLLAVEEAGAGGRRGAAAGTGGRGKPQGAGLGRADVFNLESLSVRLCVCVCRGNCVLKP